MECCYKVFRREIIKKIRIQENRFGIEPELTAKIAKLNCRIYEVGIHIMEGHMMRGKKLELRMDLEQTESKKCWKKLDFF